MLGERCLRASARCLWLIAVRRPNVAVGDFFVQTRRLALHVGFVPPMAVVASASAQRGRVEPRLTLLFVVSWSSCEMLAASHVAHCMGVFLLRPLLPVRRPNGAESSRVSCCCFSCLGRAAKC